MLKKINFAGFIMAIALNVAFCHKSFAQIVYDHTVDGLNLTVLEPYNTFMSLELTGVEDPSIKVLNLPEIITIPGVFEGLFPREGKIMEIGDRAFYHSALESISLPIGVTKIGKQAFAESRKLKYIELPTGLLSIGQRAFNDCAFREMKVPESVIFIEFGAFAGSLLNKIELPSTLQALGGCVFRTCSYLKDIYCYAPIPPKADDTDFGVFPISEWNLPTSQIMGPSQAGCTIHVPEESVELYKNAPGWNLFFRIVPIEPTEVEEIEFPSIDVVNYFMTDDGITLLGNEGDSFTIYDESGILLDTGNIDISGSYTYTGKGIRLIKVNQNSLKINL